MKKLYILGLAFVLPSLTFAASASTLLTSIGGWLATIGQILFAAVVVAFIWGLLLFVFSDERRESGKSLMLWGIIAIFVMASIWGLVGFIQSSTGVSAGSVGNVNQILPTITP